MKEIIVHKNNTEDLVSNAYLQDCIKGMKTFPDKYFEWAIVDIEYGIGASSPSEKPQAVRQRNGEILRIKKTGYEKKILG